MGVLFDLLSEVMDVDSEVVGLVGVFPAPDLGEKHIVGAGVPSVLHEATKKLILDGGKVEGFPPQVCFLAPVVNPQPFTNLDHLGVG